MVWVKYLKKRSSARDKEIFSLWENKKIDTKECINQFRINNNIPEKYIIIELQFEYWLNSLGWIRRE